MTSHISCILKSREGSYEPANDLLFWTVLLIDYAHHAPRVVSIVHGMSGHIFIDNNNNIVNSDVHADTTDVQVVTATLMEGVDASIIQCEFVAGSTASGCMVVLTGFRKYKISLTRNINTNSATTTVTLEHPPSCYTGVEAVDIESDGSLAVPGQLEGRLETPCVPVEAIPGSQYLLELLFTNNNL